MEIVYVLLPLSLLLAIGGFLAFTWGSKSGQWDDLDTPATKMLIDEENAATKSDRQDVPKV